MFFDDLYRYRDFYIESEKEILSYLRFAACSATIITVVSLLLDIHIYGEYRLFVSRSAIIVSSAIVLFYDFLIKKKRSSYKKTVYLNVLFHLFITASITGMVFVVLTGGNFPQMYTSNIVMTLSLVIVSQSYFISKAQKFFYLSIVPPVAAMTLGLILNNVSSEIWLTLFNFYVLIIIVLYLGYRKTSKDIRDFYETKRRSEEILKLKESCIKDDIVSNLSHELRTPLMGIIGIQELVMEMDITEEQRTLLGMSKESGYQLLNMINDLLEVSTINEYRISLKLKETDICKLARQVFDQICPVECSKDIEFVFRCNSEKPLMVMADPVKLGQVLNNLMANACKFTEKGSVLFDVSKIYEDRDIVEIQFVIEDTGIGIPQDKISRIYDRFYQVDSGMSKRFKGTGIGLSIVKTIADLMGGSIDCQSIQGKGSIFCFKAKFAKLKKN